MKQLKLILLLLLVSLISLAQEPAPVSPQSVNSQFYIKITGSDTAVWHFKGAPYGWNRVAKYSDFKNFYNKTQSDARYSFQGILINPDLNNTTTFAKFGIYTALGNTNGPVAGGVFQFINSPYGAQFGVNYDSGSGYGQGNTFWFRDHIPGTWKKVSDSTTIANTYVNKIAQPNAIRFFGDSIITFGNSIMLGQLASAGNEWITLTAKALGSNLKNGGSGGTTLENGSPSAPFGTANNMVSRVGQIPVYNSHKAMLVFMYTTNDACYNGGTYTPTNYASAWDYVLNYAINTKGWPRQKILIVGAPYVGAAGFAYVATASGNAAQTTAGYKLFADKDSLSATKWGTMFVPLYTAMKNAGGDSLLLNTAGDHLHLNDAGHRFVASVVLRYLTGNPIDLGNVNVGNITAYNTGASASPTIEIGFGPVNSYKWQRNYTTGFLDFTATQASSDKGYNFDWTGYFSSTTNVQLNIGFTGLSTAKYTIGRNNSSTGFLEFKSTNTTTSQNAYQFDSKLIAPSFIIPGGTSSQFLAADGSVITVGAGLSLNSGVISANNSAVNQTSGTSATMNSTGIYIPQNASLTTYTLPTTAAVGDIIFINGKGAGGWSIVENSGQVIHGATDTTVGTGNISSTGRYNCIAIRCITANTDWVVQNSQGSLTIL